MTIYELFIESTTDDVRLEAPLDGLSHAVVFYKRLSEMADNGVGTLTDSCGAHIILDDLSIADVNQILVGIDAVWIGKSGDPARGRATGTAEALTRFSPDAPLEATYWEI